MPQIKSAMKRIKTSEKSRLRNMSYKSKIKSSIKKFDLALSEKNKEEVIKYFKDAVSILDKSVNKGILPKNTASRQKANLTIKLNTLVEPGTVKKSTPTVPKKTVKAVKKPTVKKAAKVVKKPETTKTVKAVKKPTTPKGKIVTTKTTKTEEKPTVKKTVKAATKPATKKTETKKVKTKKVKE